mmetsp:Transcript_46097/g.122194  ORF Transcript_46097/g.122194 Transcript_46097/m.122194 type:complete len:223 (+) Transcript_46097:144-812(+)
MSHSESLVFIRFTEVSRFLMTCCCSFRVVLVQTASSCTATSMSMRIAPLFKRKHPMTNSSMPTSPFWSTSRLLKKLTGSTKCRPSMANFNLFSMDSTLRTNSPFGMSRHPLASSAKISVRRSIANRVSSTSICIRISGSIRVVSIASFTKIALMTFSIASCETTTKTTKITAYDTPISSKGLTATHQSIPPDTDMNNVSIVMGRDGKYVISSSTKGSPSDAS